LPSVKVPDELYEKLKDYAEKENKAMWEIVKDALDRLEVGDVQINLPKPKFIRLQFPAWCILGNHKVDPQKYKEQRGRDLYALWFPGLNGVICIDCLIKHVFTQEQQAKTLARLEVEIRKLRAIKRQLNKEVEELAAKYAYAEVMMGLREIIDSIDARMKTLSDAITELAFCKGEQECDEKRRELKELKRYLKEVKEKLEKLEIPESWAKKVAKPRKGEEVWVESRRGFWK